MSIRDLFAHQRFLKQHQVLVRGHCLLLRLHWSRLTAESLGLFAIIPVKREGETTRALLLPAQNRTRRDFAQLHNTQYPNLEKGVKRACCRYLALTV
jgi:hypothetical protein